MVVETTPFSVLRAFQGLQRLLLLYHCLIVISNAVARCNVVAMVGLFTHRRTPTWDCIVLVVVAQC